jgi:hypothetical protein
VEEISYIGGIEVLVTIKGIYVVDFSLNIQGCFSGYHQGEKILCTVEVFFLQNTIVREHR